MGSAESSHHGLARTSLNSDVARPVTVVNETVAPVQVYWVNYEGALPARALVLSIRSIRHIVWRLAACFALRRADTGTSLPFLKLKRGQGFACATLLLGQTCTKWGPLSCVTALWPYQRHPEKQ